MRARIRINGLPAGVLEKFSADKYRFTYDTQYKGAAVSLTMPTNNPVYEFNTFPSFFEGLLPEGVMLDALLRKYKLDKKDYFGQLLKVGHDVIGAVTIEEME